MAINVPLSLTPKRFHVAGDSITHGNFGGLSPGAWGWPDAPGGLFDQMTAALSVITPTSQIYPAAYSGAKAVAANGSIASRLNAVNMQIPTFTKFGVGGAAIHDCLNSMAAYVTSWNPDILILEFAINDYFFWNNGGRLQSYVDQHLIDYSAVVDQARSQFPTIQVLGMGCMVDDETWGTGPLRWLNNLPLPAVNPIDLNIGIIAAARSSWMHYYPMGDWTIAYEQAHNAPAPGVATGILTLDGIHPNLNGQIEMGSHVITNFTFSA